MEKSTEMPELKAGLVVQINSGDYMLMMDSMWGYRFHHMEEKLRSLCEIESPEDVKRVYRYNPLPTSLYPWPFPTVDAIHALVNGAWGQWDLLWERPEYKEMTVEQIEKQLGYKIKVVGNDNR